MSDRPRAQLHVVVDRARVPGDPVSTVASALKGGVDWVQLRDHGGSAAEIYALACKLHRICAAAGAGLIINDRVDVALAVGAEGVHLGAASLAPAVVRALAGARLVVGCSVHALEEAVRAAAGGADYVTFGHVFATASHPGVSPRGVAALRRIVEAVDVPVVAVGGMTPENVVEVAATGCAGVAVVGAVLGAPDPAAAARAFQRALAGQPQPRRPLSTDPAGRDTTRAYAAARRAEDPHA